MNNPRTRRAARLQKVRAYSIASIVNQLIAALCFFWGTWQFDDGIYDGAMLTWSISFITFVCALVCIGLAHDAQDTA